MSDVVERAKAALEGVADGPWEVTGGVVWRVDVIAVPDPNDPTGQTPMPEQVQEKVCDTSALDAPFIAAARSLVPELVAEVERLQELCREAACGLGWYLTGEKRGNGQPPAERVATLITELESR